MPRSSSPTPANTSAKLDTLLERTVVLEGVAKLVANHEATLYGPDHNDGVVSDVLLLKQSICDFRTTMKAILIPLGTAFILSFGGFVWGLLTNTIEITLGK